MPLWHFKNQITHTFGLPCSKCQLYYIFHDEYREENKLDYIVRLVKDGSLALFRVISANDIVSRRYVSHCRRSRCISCCVCCVCIVASINGLAWVRRYRLVLVGVVETVLALDDKHADKDVEEVEKAEEERNDEVCLVLKETSFTSLLHGICLAIEGWSPLKGRGYVLGIAIIEIFPIHGRWCSLWYSCRGGHCWYEICVSLR
jgi:hypothetical protein